LRNLAHLGAGANPARVSCRFTGKAAPAVPENAMHRFTQWRDQIAVAPDIEAVNAIMRDYVDAIAPFVQVLPSACRDVLDREMDVQSAAVTLLHEEVRFEGDEEARALLQEVAYTFAAASMRITVLYAASAARTLGIPAAGA
jgi:hypothetical protein